ncbi:hypothetical protein NDI56_03465 [Haloarcula sp. S1CR25-12]|uniref:CDP-Glycerol:Poly(Glycerophosphate) glycerophosphotransferase n=1 Tax=Haloarcula saliterrae TaxID=2950534 RepID=A0ABU2F872_9EURY|nr:hypothetical protein [Haloarcula sp. S1CR25-12]MDS0258467.1 hypothetical protein [Haloarcula sp. S1CR25-12]
MSRDRLADDGDEPGAFLRRHPLAYAAYRINYLLENDRDISENDEVPFITAVFFPVVLVGYVVLARARGLAARLVGNDSRPSLGADGHLFIMSSQSGYRTETFLEVAGALRERDHDVLLLCSPAAETRQDEWEADGFATTSHRTLHGYLRLWRVLRNALYAAVLVYRLRKVAGIPLGRLSLCYNFLLLETVKRESVGELVSGDPRIHTFSPMPYVVAASEPDRTFVYQHGLQQPIAGRIMAAPFFAPLTYLLWGDPWRELFAEYAHPDSRMAVVGNPWHDQLARKGEQKGEATYDVLFVSGSHAAVDSDIEADFERLVEDVVGLCEREGYSLAIKLHPLESPAWFEERGWASYVTDFDDIDDALLSSRVSVTNGSTAFIESAVVGVPAIVADLWEYDLDALAPVTNVTFTNGPRVAPAIADALSGRRDDGDESRMPVRLGNATERIVDVVTE